VLEAAIFGIAARRRSYKDAAPAELSKHTLQVSAIYIYPIKSCRGISVPSAEVESRGLKEDRRFMLVDAKGRCVTQRDHSRMALIDVHRDEGGYRVEAPGQPPLHVPQAARGGECEVKIWSDTVQARLVGEGVDAWFSQYLGFTCGLVHMEDHQHRPVTNESAAFDDEVSFADAAPLLLISTASLEDLNARLTAPVAMRRFRPNVVVDTDTPFAEDAWKSIAIGAAQLAVAWPCSRCVLTTIDPESGVRDARGEPLETLKTYRRVGPRVMFGQNLVPRRRGTIRVGDAVRLQ
jgi:hypothetical protein